VTFGHDETVYVRIDIYHFDSRIFCLDRQLIKNADAFV